MGPIKKNKFKIQYLKSVKNNYNHFIKDTSWVTLNQIISVILGVLISVILARFTTKIVFGEYNLLISIVSILSIVAIPGLNTSMLRSISRGKEGVYTKAVKLSFNWSFLGIPLLILIGFYFYFYAEQSVGIALFLSAIFFPLLYAPNNWTALLQGKKKFDIFAKFSIIQSLLRALAIIMAVYLGSGTLVPIFLAYMIVNSFTNIFYFFKCKAYINNDLEEEGWQRSGYKLTFNDFVMLSYDYIDKIFIGIFIGPVELAIYAVAVSVVSAIRGSVIQIIKVTYPHIFAMQKEKIKVYFQKIMLPLIIFNLIFLLILVLILPLLMIILYSQKYEDSIIYAQMYCITIPLAIFMVVLNTSLIALKKENAIIKFRLLGLIIILILYSILIPFMGVIGAIISSIIYYVVLIILQYLYLRSR